MSETTRTHHILCGDAQQQLALLDDASVNCIITSPPYWGLRDYDAPGQLGLEDSFAEYLARMVAIFAGCRRVLAEDGVLWLNMGDSYVGSASPGAARAALGLRPKNMLGQPWRLAFALQEAGWYLRQDIIWHKPNTMPESARDRCTKAHEYLFLLSKSPRYYFDQAAIREPVTGNAHRRVSVGGWASSGTHDAVAHNQAGVHPKARNATPAEGAPRPKQNASFAAAVADLVSARNKRSVWTIPTEPAFSESHFAAFPTALVRPCVLAGCPPNGTVLDPFAGTGTVMAVANELGRNSISFDISPEYCSVARERRDAMTPALFSTGEQHADSTLDT